MKAFVLLYCLTSCFTDISAARVKKSGGVSTKTSAALSTVMNASSNSTMALDNPFVLQEFFVKLALHVYRSKGAWAIQQGIELVDGLGYRPNVNWEDDVEENVKQLMVLDVEQNIHYAFLWRHMHLVLWSLARSDRLPLQTANWIAKLPTTDYGLLEKAIIAEKKAETYEERHNLILECGNDIEKKSAVMQQLDYSPYGGSQELRLFKAQERELVECIDTLQSALDGMQLPWQCNQSPTFDSDLPLESIACNLLNQLKSIYFPRSGGYYTFNGNSVGIPQAGVSLFMYGMNHFVMPEKCEEGAAWAAGNWVLGCVDNTKPCPEAASNYFHGAERRETGFVVKDIKDTNYWWFPSKDYALIIDMDTEQGWSWSRDRIVKERAYLDCVEVADEDGDGRAQGISFDKEHWFKWSNIPGLELTYISDFKDSNGLKGNLFIKRYRSW